MVPWPWLVCSNFCLHPGEAPAVSRSTRARRATQRIPRRKSSGNRARAAALGPRHEPGAGGACAWPVGRGQATTYVGCLCLLARARVSLGRCVLHAPPAVSQSPPTRRTRPCMCRPLAPQELPVRIACKSLIDRTACGRQSRGRRRRRRRSAGVRPRGVCMHG